MVHKIICRLPEAHERFWQTFVKCAKSDPAALRYIVILMAFYLHPGLFARQVIAAIDAKLAELDLAVAAAPVAKAVAKSDPYHGRSYDTEQQTSQLPPVRHAGARDDDPNLHDQEEQHQDRVERSRTSFQLGVR